MELKDPVVQAMIQQVKRELAQSLSIYIESYNEPFDGPRLRVQLSLDNEVITEWDTDIPEPKRYSDF